MENKIFYEPLQCNRFLVRFPEELGIYSWTIARAQVPSFDVKHYFKPEPITITLYNYTCNRLFDVSKWFLNDEPILHDIQIELLDPTGLTLHLFQLNQCKLLHVKYSELDYSIDGDVSHIFTYITILPQSVVTMQPKNTKILNAFKQTLDGLVKDGTIVNYKIKTNVNNGVDEIILTQSQSVEHLNLTFKIGNEQ